MSEFETYTLLVVDDEPNIVRAIRRLFRGDTMNLETAGSGEEALQIVREKPIHVLLTDNRMPGMPGIELVRKVRTINPDIVRMIISGQSDMDALLDAINDGEVFRFISKPWSDVDLKIAVNLAMAHRRLQDDNRCLKKRLATMETLLAKLKAEHPAIYDGLLQGTPRPGGAVEHVS